MTVTRNDMEQSPHYLNSQPSPNNNKMRRFQITTLLSIGLVPVCFGVSLALLSFYQLGDQAHYLKFFESLSEADRPEIMAIARSVVSSSEPISAYTLWLGAHLGIDKNLYVSFLNVLLLVGLFLLLRRHRASWYVHALLFTNFYLIVLLTGAERLKIAYIILVYATFLNRYVATVVACLSPFAHLSSIVLLFGLVLAKSSDGFRALILRFSLRKFDLFILIIIGVISLAWLVYLQEGLLQKASIYVRTDGSITELINVSFLLFAGLILYRDRLKCVLALLPMFVAVFFLGGTRVNMLAISLFIYLLLQENKLHHPLAILLLMYLSIKSVPFVYNIFVYGNGFGGWLL